ncbi:MAG: calycin-like domain-containing protein [Prevotella sp.]|nr:calycin-like domain-containing protein [Prevotella sp.]
MKKILSLLSMLMITVTAFATSYTDKLTYKLTVLQTVTKELPAGELTVEPYGKSNYTVTAKGCDFSEFGADNWYEIVCEDVPGTTDANGVTTITQDNPYALRTSDNAVFTGTKLVVKFNGTKAYARFEGQIALYGVNRPFEYTFGTDDFESTGGGEPGGEDKPAIVDVVEADYAPNGTKFAFPFTINWETQKLVAKLDLSTCSRYTHNEGIITVGTNNGRGDVSLWEPNIGEANCHLYYTRYNYGTDEKVLNLHYLEKPSDEVVRVDNSLQNLEPGLVVFTFDKDGLHVGDNLIATPAQMTTLYNSTSLIFGSKEGTTRSYATYKYVKVVPADWTETTEPEVTEVSSKSFEDKLYAFADGENIEQGNATVKISNMSDETIKMSLVFGDTTIESANIEQGTDDKGRTTYTGTADWEGVNFAVSAVVYTKDEAEKIYMTLTSNDAKYTVGTDPDYVAPEPPSIEGTVVEGSVDFAANGSKFEWSNIAIDWNKQKLVAVIDLSTCVGTNEDILSVGQNISAWNIGGWHFYYTKSENRMKSDYLTTGGAHPISDANTPVEPGIVRIELSKAEGCTIDGVSFNGFYDSSVTGTWQSNTEDFWNLTSVNIGSKEGNGRSNAVIKYVTVVDIESTEPETPKAVVYKNTLKIVRGTDTKEYTDAEVSVLAKGEGKYEVVLPEFSDMDSAEGTIPGTIGKLTFVADGVEADGKLKLTASSVETTQEGGEGWESQTFTASMDATVENDQLAGTFTVVVDGYETMYTYNLYYGVEAPEVVTEVSNDNYTSNLRILDGETTVVEEAEANVNIVKYSDESYKVTLKDVTLNENTQDLVFVGKALIEEAPTEATEPLTIIAKSDEATTAFFGEEMNGTFELTEVSADEIKMEFAIEGEGVLYEGEFNYEAKTPATEPFCKENYVADGNGFEWEFAVDWDTQKVVMSIDPSTCTGNCEDVIGLGAVPTAWVNTLHLYRTRADKMLQGYFQVPGVSNNNTDKFAETVPFLVEVSKAQGFVVNDEVKIAASAMSYLFTLPTVKMGTGEGANDKSRATYNYVKVVDKDWTKDPETGINATTVAEGEFEVFSVDGVKLSKLQKGLNIVRSADGKVKKVLVK